MLTFQFPERGWQPLGDKSHEVRISVGFLLWLASLNVQKLEISGAVKISWFESYASLSDFRYPVLLLNSFPGCIVNLQKNETPCHNTADESNAKSFGNSDFEMKRTTAVQKSTKFTSNVKKSVIQQEQCLASNWAIHMRFYNNTLDYAIPSSVLLHPD